MTTDPDGDDTSRRGQSSPEYPGGTAGYSGPTGPPDAQGRSGADGGADGEQSGRRPFWLGLGFDSFEAYMKYLKRMQTLYEPLPRGTPAPVPHVPGAHVGEVERPPPLEHRRRQVNVKLRDSEGAELDEAARIYGLAPSTLARLLVNRGVKAILEEYGG